MSQAFVPLDEDFVYPQYEVAVSAEEQTDKLACCNISPEVYGDYVDVTHFAVETIMAAKHGGATINGSVHMTQEFEVREPVRLGETLTISGEVTGVEAVAKGDVIGSRFEFARADGSVPLVLSRTSLRADPDRMPRTQEPTRQTATQPDDGLTFASAHPLEPDKVARYSTEAENLIHSDPDVARQFGFEKPIAGGLMAVRLMMAHLWQSGTVAGLNMSVRFLRPMFWDDVLQLHISAAEPRQIVMKRERDGKVANQAVVHQVIYG